MSHTPSLEISSVKESSGASSPDLQGFMHKHVKKYVLNAVKIGVTFGILYYLYSKGMLDFSRVKNVLTNPSVVAISFVLMCLTQLAGVLRWRMLVIGQGLSIPLWEAVRLTMIGVFFNTAIPGAVSGDLVKGYYVVRQQPDGRGRIRAFTTLLMDRILGLSALIFVSFIAMLLNLNTMLGSPVLKSLSGLISILFVGIVCFYAFVLFESSLASRLQQFLAKLPAGEYFVKLFEAVKSYENCRHYIVRGFLISVVIHCTIVGVFILLGKSLGGFEDVSLGKFFFLAPLGLLVTAIPVAPAGLGTGHAAFLWLFKQAGSTVGADLFTAFVSFQILISLIGGLFYVKYRGHLPKDE